MWHLIPVRTTAAILSLIGCLVLSFQPRASAQFQFGATDGPGAEHHTRVTLLLSDDVVRPGDTVLAAVHLRMDPGWHTYWKNPGDAGTATKIDWTLPPGVSAGAIEWPIPQKLPPADVTTYGYEGATALIIPLTIASNLSPGTLQLSAKVSWLECKDTCLPADTVVEAKINVGNETKASKDAPQIQLWQNDTPRSDHLFTFHAWWEKGPTDDNRPLLISGSQADDKILSLAHVDFFPDASDDFEVQAATERIPVSTGFELRKMVKKYSGNWPTNLSGLIVIKDDHETNGFPLQVSIGEKPAISQAAASATLGPTSLAKEPLGKMLIFAFIGGLILNIMPCVLPVIALKILGFVGEAKSEPRRVRRLGLVYTFGVLASFLVLAGVVIGVDAAGKRAGWGMQFGSPVFVVCLTTLVLLVALNLFGVFEVALGGRALDSANTLASKSGAPGAFFNGVLATTLATPCTAPFLAPALGFAFAQSAPVIIIVFLTVGLGLSAPYIILSWHPAWLRFLPKPGVWMEKFKIGMGFPMLATLVWLFNIASDNYGKNVVWLGVFLVLVAFAAWVFGEFVQRGRKHRVLAGTLALAVLIGAYGGVLERELNWRVPVESSKTGAFSESKDGINWQPWTPEAVAAARAAGKPVLVDFTADWCLTCQVNKKTSIEVDSVRQKLKSLNVVTLVGDYTHFPEAITKELNHYDRAGVPLVLVYPKDTEGGAIVLPSVLTPGIVLSALDRAN